MNMKKILPLVLVHVLILAVFICNGLYVSYPDEHVNLLAGKALNQGKLPYSEFFDHHLPFAWELGAQLLKVSFNNFVLFRVAWASLAFGLLALVGLYIRKRKVDMYPYYLFFLFLYPFFTVYFWLHLFIADALACLFFSLAFWLTLAETWREKSNIGGIILATFFTFALTFSSLTFIFVAGALYFWQFYLVLRDHRNPRDIIAFLFFAALPYVYYVLNLLLSGTFKDFWFSNYVYNSVHYVKIENYTPGAHFNPIKFGGAILYNFYNEYLPLLTTVKYFDIYLPILTLAAWSTLCLLLVLFFENKLLFVLYFIILSFSAPRSSISSYKETDYQMGLFLILGLISALVVLYRHKFVQFKDPAINIFKNASMAVVVLFTLFSAIFLIKNTYDKAYQRYIGFMPGIYNRTFVSRFIDEIVRPGEYFWVGPYEPHHEFPVKYGMLPGKYPTLLPQFREDEYLKTDFIKQFEKNPPVFLVFKHESSIFGTPADVFGKFFTDWMKGKYVTIEDLPEYKQIKSPTEFNLKGDLYINLTYKDEMLKRLMDAGYVERL